MPAAYQRELDFMLTVLGRLRTRARVLREDDPFTGIDVGLRAMLGLVDDFSASFLATRRWTQDRTIYKMMDQFLCNYIYFRLPGSSLVVIGPYLTIDPSQEMLLEQSERLGLPMQTLPQQADYYATLPVFNDPSAMMAVVYTFAESLWGSAGSFDVLDMNFEQESSLSHSAASDAPIEQTDVLQQMKLMEDRYAYEDALMKIVARGQTNQVEVMLSSVSRLVFQQRVADPLRNMKNYSIIFNTLLRKAAQHGGVHPLYLDRISSQYARTIENVPTLEAFQPLISEMIRAYCRLVRTHASAHYSALVQKTIVYIDANLSSDLSLTTLAAHMSVSPGYLSTLFHRETGESLTDYILSLRMRAALQLLSTTRLQVQTIAQLCGFSDPNYFGKLFRKHCGMTPLQYRREQAGRPRQDG